MDELPLELVDEEGQFEADSALWSPVSAPWSQDLELEVEPGLQWEQEK